MKLKIIFYIIFTGICWNTLSSQSDSLFSKANDAYTNGDYKEAQRLYLSILDQDLVSADLYFNLGNTYYKTEEIAKSIYYYEKALKLNPDAENIKNNLAFAERMRLDQFEKLPDSELNKGFNSFIKLLSVDGWSVTGIILLFLSAVMFALFLLRKKPFIKRLSLGISIFFVILSVSAFGIAQTQLKQIESNTYAIIFEKEKPVFEEPNVKAGMILELHEGTKVKILDQFRTFYKVELPDGTIGWMETTNLRKI
jgi:tetratricopeptide (TPR) repeat protein